MTRSSRTVIIAIAAGTLVALVLTVLVVNVLVGDDADSPGAELSLTDVETTEPSGDPAPDITFERFDGSQGTLADYAGTPLVVNFFASWCAPCRQEMPDFEEVHQALGDDVAFLGFNVGDTREDGQRLVEETGITWDLARDPDQGILAEFGGLAMPTTVLINADGRVVDVHGGILAKSSLEEKIRTELLT